MLPPSAWQPSRSEGQQLRVGWSSALEPNVGFTILRGTFLGSLLQGDPTIRGFILGSPIFVNSHDSHVLYAAAPWALLSALEARNYCHEQFD